MGFVKGLLILVVCISIFITLDEILDALRIKRGEIVEDKNSVTDETEKAKNEVENSGQTDLEKNKEESADQLQDKTEETSPEQDSEKGKAEGKESSIGLAITFFL